MKNQSLFITLLAVLISSACGSNLKTGKHPQSYTAQVEVNEWGATLEEGCRSRNGRFFKQEELCVYTSLSKDLAGGKYGKSEEVTALEIGNISTGQAVLATGLSTKKSVQVSLDGQIISAVPSPEAKPITVGKNGKLEFQLQPGGDFDEVKVTIISCVDKSLREVRCPY